MTASALGALIALSLFEAPSADSVRAEPIFLRGVEALHNFQYEDAVEVFREAQRVDPAFVLAYWGEAMAYNQTLWLNQDAETARQVLQRLGPTSQERASKAGTDRERGLLRAVEALFARDQGKDTRDRVYAEAMGSLAASYPEDPDVQAFHALALLGTTARSPALFREGGDDPHQHALVGSETQRRVAAILEKVLASHPRHPGALHYLIHSYDDPDHARLALPAARAYAKVAPDSSHALHMPAHIFVQLGMWDEAAACDDASFRASQAWVERKRLPIAMRDYHSLSWLLYESLQQGRYGKARETLDLIRAAIAQSGAARLEGILSDMRARYVVDTRRFEELSGTRDFGTNGELFAIGMSAARRNDSSVALMALGELRRRAGSEEAGNRRSDVAVMEKELAALVAVAAGRSDDAVLRMKEAVALERELPPPLGPPRPIKPVAELFGEILLDLGHPRDAVAEFERALRLWPNRSLTLLGLARASKALGDRDAARRSYGRLLANWRSADPELPELREARTGSRGTGSSPRGGTGPR